jgi:hypothetical protein
MNKEEARAMLAQQLALYHARQYKHLLPLLDESEWLTVAAPSGQTYYVQIHAVWDDEARGHLRVMGNIADGTLRRFMSPLCDDFIVRPDGSFVGE